MASMRRPEFRFLPLCAREAFLGSRRYGGKGQDGRRSIRVSGEQMPTYGVLLRRCRAWRTLVALLLVVTPLSGRAAETKPETKPESPTFTQAQLEQLVAPIALYPDGLIVQILISSTYPLEVVEAARWRTKNKDLKDDALDKALESQDWDPSLKTLTKFPEVLQRMSDNLDWTKDLGDAFLASQADVMDTIQRMRAKAMDTGSLKTTEQQTVTKEVVNNKETIVIQPSNPEVVYVPQYESSPQVYGPSYAYPQPYYPAMAAPYP